MAGVRTAFLSEYIQYGFRDQRVDPSVKPFLSGIDPSTRRLDSAHQKAPSDWQSWMIQLLVGRSISHHNAALLSPPRVLYSFQPWMASGFSALDEPTMTATTNQDDDLRRGRLWCCSSVLRTGAWSSSHRIFNKNAEGGFWLFIFNICLRMELNIIDSCIHNAFHHRHQFPA